MVLVLLVNDILFSPFFSSTLLFSSFLSFSLALFLTTISDECHFCVKTLIFLSCSAVILHLSTHLNEYHNFFLVKCSFAFNSKYALTFLCILFLKQVLYKRYYFKKSM
jgi:hypothetical protein